MKKAQEGQLDQERSLCGKPLGKAESTEDAEESIATDTLATRGKREENGSLNPIGVGAEDTHPKNRGAAQSGRSFGDATCRSHRKTRAKRSPKEKGGKKARERFGQKTFDELPNFQKYMEYKARIKTIKTTTKKDERRQITVEEVKVKMKKATEKKREQPK